jgi:hypothetical protein
MKQEKQKAKLTKKFILSGGYCVGCVSTTEQLFQFEILGALYR